MQNNLTAEEQSRRQTESRRSQLDMFALQSDKARLARKHDDLKAEMRRMQTDLAHLKSSLAEKTEAERLLVREIEQTDETLSRAKKHLDTLK